ncbi:hypothetical protein GW17_00057732 [Ensete ventricosum]|nr:hypothetical protein GW17_00057732 [Ensete ventricosum]
MKEWCRSPSRVGGRGPSGRTIDVSSIHPHLTPGSQHGPANFKWALPIHLRKIRYLLSKKGLVLRMSLNPTEVPHRPGLRYGFIPPSVAPLPMRTSRGVTFLGAITAEASLRGASLLTSTFIFLVGEISVVGGTRLGNRVKRLLRRFGA